LVVDQAVYKTVFGRLAPDGAVSLGAWQRGETALFLLPLLEVRAAALTPSASRIDQKRRLAITLARAIIASPHSHEDESSWY
jgi:hypothetical protein